MYGSAAPESAFQELHDPEPQAHTSPAPVQLLDAIPPPGMVLLAIVSIQLGAAFAVRLFPLLGPLGLVSLRVGLGALLLLVVSRRSLRRTARSHGILLVLFGAVIAEMNLCFYESIARIPLGVTVSIEFIGPLGVAVATSRRPRDFFWIALAVAGVAMLSPEVGRALDPLGVLFAVLAGTGWGTFVVIGRRISRSAAGEAGLALGMAAGAVFLLPAALASGALSSLNPMLLAAALGVALLSTAIPLSLEFRALRRLSPRAYGVLVTLEPAVAVSVGAIVLNQPLGATTLFAVACVSAAALGITVSERGGG